MSRNVWGFLGGQCVWLAHRLHLFLNMNPLHFTSQGNQSDESYNYSSKRFSDPLRYYITEEMQNNIFCDIHMNSCEINC